MSLLRLFSNGSPCIKLAQPKRIGRSRRAYYRSPITFPIPDSRFPITDYGLRITDYSSRITGEFNIRIKWRIAFLIKIACKFKEWSFLLFSGYLEALSRDIIDGEMICSLVIPNREIQTIYRDIVKSWFNDSVHPDFLRTMLKSLISGQTEVFNSHFREYVQSSFSNFDTGGKVPQKIYHAFVLGLIIGLRPNYEIKSNREGGYGRYDVVVIPQDISQAGIIIEFKSVEQDEAKDLEQIAQLALQQIEAEEYQQELFDRGIYKIIKLGIVFRGKEVVVKARD